MAKKKGTASKCKGTVGVVGFGIMGGAFARNLAAARWRVVGYDTMPRFAGHSSGRAWKSPRMPARLQPTAPVIITSLPLPWRARRHGRGDCGVEG